MFPLDEYFRLLMSIFFLGWVFFCVGFRHRFLIYRGSGLAFGWARAPPLRPPLRASRSAPALGPSRMPSPTPGKLETDDESQQKKILSQEKKNTHQQTKILIQRKHVYAYDMPFLCPPNLCAILINRGITIIIPQYMNLFLQENSFSVCALTLHIAGIYFYN